MVGFIRRMGENLVLCEYQVSGRGGRGWAHGEEHKKKFGLDSAGDVEPPEHYEQGNGMVFVGYSLRMLVLPLEKCSKRHRRAQDPQSAECLPPP